VPEPEKVGEERDWGGSERQRKAVWQTRGRERHYGTGRHRREGCVVCGSVCVCNAKVVCKCGVVVGGVWWPVCVWGGGGGGWEVGSSGTKEVVQRHPVWHSCRDKKKCLCHKVV